MQHHHPQPGQKIKESAQRLYPASSSAARGKRLMYQG